MEAFALQHSYDSIEHRVHCLTSAALLRLPSA
jgi:hypothetical protein